MKGQSVTSVPRGQRADACRNHDRIIHVATELLAEHPGATMDELTAATGLGRTTVYRHFHTREQLVAQVYTTAFTGTRLLVEEAGLHTCAPAELLERAVTVLMRAVRTYPVLVNGPGLDLTAGATGPGAEHGACLEALSGVMRRAQRANLLDAALPSRWLAGALLDDCVGAVSFAAELRGCGQDPGTLVRAAFQRAWAVLP